MIHIDERLKDAAPRDTVERIYRLLKAQNIEICEEWLDSGIPDCYSVRVTIAGTSLGTNGKGVTKELARASGCAELMERLQSGFRGAGRLHFPDEKTMTREELLKASGSILQQITDCNVQCENTDCSADEILDACFSFGKTESTSVIPLYNANDGTKVDFPVYLLKSLYSSNGLAAGNSTEEAIVQGFSEIVERYCQCRIMRENLVPPTIPAEYLEQFPTAFGIIQSLQAAGYTVLIKDCSLGEGYPVIASAIIDRKSHGYRVIFGSSPVFEIALERSLTEQLQGYTVKKIPFITEFFASDKRTASDFEAAFVSGRGTYSLDFFTGESSYPFVPPADRSGATNKELLSFIMQYLRQNGRTMLVRDLSHFGFPTYRILVPGMSEMGMSGFTGKPSYCRLTFETAGVARNMSKASVDQLFAYTLRYMSTPVVTAGPIPFTSLSGLPFDINADLNSYWGLISMAYAMWGIGNPAQSMKYLSAALLHAPEDKRDLTRCLFQYLTYRRKGQDGDQLMCRLAAFYCEDVINQLREIVKEANPFAALLPCCEGKCTDCEWREICKIKENYLISERLNTAAASFDTEKAFHDLSVCFSLARTSEMQPV